MSIATLTAIGLIIFVGLLTARHISLQNGTSSAQVPVLIEPDSIRNIPVQVRRSSNHG